MNLSRLDIAEVAGTIAGAANARHNWRERRFLDLRLRDDRARDGRGEASPLPGFSPESLEQCRQQLHALSRAIAQEDLAARIVTAPHFAITVHRAGADDDDPPPLAWQQLSAPAARFAAETAILDLASQDAEVPLWSYLRQSIALPDISPDTVVPLNALISETDPARARDQMTRGYERGIRCFKFKIGRDLARERAMMATARADYGDRIRLRADANQSLSPTQARTQLQPFAELALDYVEEPVADPGRHLQPQAPWPLPVALDESIAPAPACAPNSTQLLDLGTIESMLKTGMVRALIIKPMRLGTWAYAMALSALCRRYGADAVITHLFDGPIALAAYAHLALALAPSPPCGLDRHGGLQAWRRDGATEEHALSYIGACAIAPPQTPGLVPHN